jgi:ribonuclease BN (tRNA processing enzyme)
MRLAFLGTGSAFSVERYNGAVVVDGRILLDGGAPLLPHMHRLGIDPAAIQAVFLTHMHGDHILGLPPFVLYRAFNASDRPLPIVAPPGGEGPLEELFQLSWGRAWAEHRDQAHVVHLAAGECGEVAGISYRAVRLDHGGLDCRGYRLEIEGRVLAYAGDTMATPQLDELVEGADVAITEATAPGDAPAHTSWEEAAALAARHPRTRFLFNHIYQGDPEGAAHDLEVIDV